MRRLITWVLCIAVIAMFGGCDTARRAEIVQGSVKGEKVTVGTVQREIRKGMSGAEVAEALGSPNIVSTDEQGREVWIYDKIATDRVYSKGASGVLVVLLLAHVESGASSTSQRTLTIIIKFDNEKKVRDFAYHSSRF